MTTHWFSLSLLRQPLKDVGLSLIWWWKAMATCDQRPDGVTNCWLWVSSPPRCVSTLADICTQVESLAAQFLSSFKHNVDITDLFTIFCKRQKEIPFVIEFLHLYRIYASGHLNGEDISWCKVTLNLLYLLLFQFCLIWLWIHLFDRRNQTNHTCTYWTAMIGAHYQMDK